MLIALRKRDRKGEAEDAVKLTNGNRCLKEKARNGILKVEGLVLEKERHLFLRSQGVRMDKDVLGWPKSLLFFFCKMALVVLSCL